MQIDAVMFDGAFDRLPAFRFNRPARSACCDRSPRPSGPGCHRAVPAPSSESRGDGSAPAIPHTPRAGTNDFRAAQTDPRDLLPLLQREARDLFGNAAHHLAGGVRRRPALPRTSQVAGDAHQGGGCAGGGNHGAHTRGLDPILNTGNLPRHKALEPLQFALARRIVLEEFSGQAHRPERQTHRIPEVAVARQRELATAAAQVHQQNAAGIHAPGGNNAQVNEAGLFQSGNDFDRPARRRAYPLQKYAGITGIAQRRRGHHLDRIRPAFLYGPIEAPQHAHRLRHRLRRKQSAAEDAFAQASDLAIFVDFLQPPACRRAIFRRTEFEPMSMAAKVGI
jgi:hypothetical protein